MNGFRSDQIETIDVGRLGRATLPMYATWLGMSALAGEFLCSIWARGKLGDHQPPIILSIFVAIIIIREGSHLHYGEISRRHYLLIPILAGIYFGVLNIWTARNQSVEWYTPTLYGCGLLFGSVLIAASTYGSTAAELELERLGIQPVPYLRARISSIPTKWPTSEKHLRHARVIQAKSWGLFLAAWFIMINLVSGVWIRAGKWWAPFLALMFISACGFWLAFIKCRTALRQHTAPQVKEVLSNDSRSHFLYLRSFSDDRMYAPVGRWLALWLGRALSFEEELTCLLWGFGPVLAAGQPGEKLPIAGAAREYAAADAWLRLIQLRSEQARLIVVMVGSTPGVLEELRLIATEGFIHKLVLVFPPLEAVTRRARWEACVPALRESCDPKLLAAVDPAAVLMIRFRNARAVTMITCPSRSVHYYKEALRVLIFKELSIDEVLATETV